MRVCVYFYNNTMCADSNTFRLSLHRFRLSVTQNSVTSAVAVRPGAEGKKSFRYANTCTTPLPKVLLTTYIL